MRYSLFGLISCPTIFVFAAVATASPTITFNSGSTINLPYTENGLVFEQFGSSTVRVADDVLFFYGSDGGMYHVRTSSPTPFDLLSIDVQSIINVFSSTDWRIESPAGGVRTLVPNVDLGTIDLTGTPGFTNISYFDIVHAYGGGRQALLVDNVVVRFVPEPSAFLLAWQLSVILMWRRRTASRH
jgi:hypothetical protein